LKASFVRAQNIATAWNHCHPWQFCLNNLFIPRGGKKQSGAITQHLPGV